MGNTKLNILSLVLSQNYDEVTSFTYVIPESLFSGTIVKPIISVTRKR